VEAAWQRIDPAIARIHVLRERELTGRLVGRCFLQWRLQPLAAWSRLMSLLSGQFDPHRMKLELLTEQEVTNRLNPLAGRPEPGELELSDAAPLPYWEGNPMVNLQFLTLFSPEFVVLLI
jgi:hypothetical protein